MEKTLQTSEIHHTAKKISYDEFLEQYPNVHAEWVAGAVIHLMTASDRHQDLVSWLIAILRLFIETYDLGWLRPAPFNMRMPRINRGREPDLLFVTKERRHIIHASHLSEAADLVIEIVSPESTERDWHTKFGEYEAAGVREYWLIDPHQEKAVFYQLNDRGHYQPLAVDDDGRLQSVMLPHFWLKVAWLWQEPLPKLITVFQALGLLK